MNAFKISLILTSQDRCEDLDRFFKSLLAQKVDFDIELIFVNQGTYNPISKLQLPSFIYYKLIDVGYSLPLSTARNIGLRYVTGSIVAFPDDDCWYEPLLLEKIRYYFSENIKIACLCTNVFDPLRHKSYGNRPTGLRQTVSFGNLFRLPISVGIFCRVEAMDVVGRRFDELLGAGTTLGSGEETEFIARLLKAGFQIEYDGCIQVYHQVMEYNAMDYIKYYNYGLGFGYLNGCLFRNGHLAVITYLIEMIIRSCAGFIFYINSQHKRDLYRNRLSGIVKGTIAGIRGVAIA